VAFGAQWALVWQWSSHHYGPAVRAGVRRFHSPDAELDFYVPEDSEDVGLLVQMMVGPAGKPGEESFDVLVCTPRWLDRRVREGGPLIGCHHLVIERWDAARIRHYLTDAVESEEAPTWPELAIKISRIGKWEFEDYRP
jgi:Immunity protein 8